MSGSLRLTVISPVLSFVSMPEMSPSMDGSFENSSVPAMIGAEERASTGCRAASMRFIVFSKSLALTGVPSLYSRPSRSWNLYVLPPFVGSGTSSARPGTSTPPSSPVSCVYVISAV